MATEQQVDKTGIKGSLISSATQLNANQPYLIALPGEKMEVSLEEKSLCFVSISDKIPATPTDLYGVGTDAKSSNSIVGTYKPLIGKPIYQLNNLAGNDSVVAFEYLSDGNVLPFQAYLLASENQENSLLPWNIQIEVGHQVGIQTIPMHQDSGYYTLQGIRLFTPQSDAIQVKNRQKVYIP